MANPEVPFLLEANTREKPSFVLSGEIGASTAVEMLNWLGHWGQECPEEQLTVFIDSIGGDLNPAITIAEAFRISPNRIRTIAMGRCYSAATVIAAAGDKGERYAYPKADFMIHQVRISGELQESVSELEETTKQFKRWHEIMLGLVSEFTGKPISQIRKDVVKEKYMTADQARDYGLIDQIIPYKK